MHRKSHLKEGVIVFCAGAGIYGLLELLWRGHTHWTMPLTGGLCLSLINACCRRMERFRLWQRCLAGCGIVTACEFLVGCLVNCVLGWKVWDYSERFGNILGQVCVGYSALWFVLCIPACLLCGFLQKRVFDHA